MTLLDVLVPTYVQMLGALSSWLDKAEAQGSDGGREALLDARLAPGRSGGDVRAGPQLGAWRVSNVAELCQSEAINGQSDLQVRAAVADCTYKSRCITTASAQTRTEPAGHA
jgi:hypothetical protein